MYPVVKWAGGKRQLLPIITKMLPKEYGTYFEPFLGGGAVYMALKPEQAVLNDLNPQLINLYEVIKKDPHGLIDGLRHKEQEYNSLPNMEEKKLYYLNSRQEYNAGINEAGNNLETAVLFVFLNKCCFNGLYRVNRKGFFNSAFGKNEKLNLCDEENIRDLAKKLYSAEITSGDFEYACRNAVDGDFVFFDSPYYGTFDTYQSGGFSEADHIRLFEVFKKLSDKGVYCMLTNSNSDFIKQLYNDYEIAVVPVKRSINGDGSKRTGEEVIITNYSQQHAA